MADEDLDTVRGEVAAAHHLTPGQAKYLAGATRAELEAAAGELLQAFPRPVDVTGRPRELHGGGDPTLPTTDLRKVVDSIPR